MHTRLPKLPDLPFRLNIILLRAFSWSQMSFCLSPRILWGRSKCNHCVCCLFSARQQSSGLPLCHGKSFPICNKHFRADGSWRLYDCVLEWCNPQTQDARAGLDEKMLPDDWQTVAKEFEIIHHCSSVLVHQNNPCSDTTFYKLKIQQ